MNIIEQKEILRKSVYDSIFNGGFSNRSNGDYGKIPDFKGSDIAAQTLAKSKEWKKSKTIFVSPDSAQTPVRYLALKDNKNLIMASPNLEHGLMMIQNITICLWTCSLKDLLRWIEKVIESAKEKAMEIGK